MGSCARPALAMAAVLATLFASPSVHAQGAATQGNLVDRVFVRYVSPETGGGAL